LSFYGLTKDRTDGINEETIKVSSSWFFKMSQQC